MIYMNVSSLYFLKMAVQKWCFFFDKIVVNWLGEVINHLHSNKRTCKYLLMEMLTVFLSNIL